MWNILSNAILKQKKVNFYALKQDLDTIADASARIMSY